MSLEYGEHSTELSRELRILAYILLAFAVYAFARGVYNLIDDFVWPRLFGDPQPPFIGLPWPYALLTVSRTALTVTIAGLCYTWVKAGQSRGWWLCGTLFASMIIGSCMGIAQMTLMRMPPDNLPLYTASPAVLVRTVIWLILGLIMLVYLCRETTMKALSVDTERKSRKVGRLFLFGLLLRLVYLALAILTSLFAAAVFY